MENSGDQRHLYGNHHTHQDVAVDPFSVFPAHFHQREGETALQSPRSGAWNPAVQITLVYKGAAHVSCGPCFNVVFKVKRTWQ